MNYFLSNLLTGENESYIIRNYNNKEFEQFCCYPNIDSFINPTMEELILSFLKKLNLFPMYIHVLSSGYKSNLSDYFRETQEINDGYFYTVGKIQNLTQLKEFYPTAYLDAANGETVVTTSEKEVPLIKTEKIEISLKYEFKLNQSNNKIFFLIIQLDGQCWDFISNFKDHPYKDTPIIDEC